MADDSGGTWSSADTGGGGGISFGDIAGIGKGVISAAGSLFGGSTQSSGYKKEAALYDQAAMLENWNETYAQDSGGIQKILAARQYNQVKGAQVAQAGANGFQYSGSNIALMREGWNQFGITKGQIDMQTGINIANFEEQKIGYAAQAEGARASAQASKGGGVMGALGQVAGIAGSLFGLFSDRRLKTDIHLIGQFKGINWYTFRFKRGIIRHIGVMAQELIDIMPEAVHLGEDGYYRVDYAKVLKR